MEPWHLKKKGETDQLKASIAVAMEVARVIGVLLQPIVPSFSDRMLGISAICFLKSRNALTYFYYRQTWCAERSEELGICPVLLQLLGTSTRQSKGSPLSADKIRS